MSSLHKLLLKNSPMMNKPLPTGGPTDRRGFGRKRDYSPVCWDKYYDVKDDVTISEGNIFRVYRTGTNGPLLVLLHGGGYSGLTWALMTANITRLVECQVVAIDLRGHGSTKTIDEEDLSATTMSDDVAAVMREMFPDEIPPVILIGHSMGGAVAVHLAYRSLIPLLGLVVIDVVEGTALDALQSMQSFLRGRPASFASIENAIEWCVRSGQVRNLESAKVSMPGQIKNAETDHLASVDISDSQGDSAALPGNLPVFGRGNSIPEESEEDEDREGCELRLKDTSPDAEKFKMPHVPMEKEHYTWRIDLSKTEKYWTGWFQGLSSKFLTCSPTKMLLLAGIDRLDKDLTIGQMQGKFQCVVLPQCGHAVHEDVPEKVAEVLASFMVRNKFAQAMDDFQMY